MKRILAFLCVLALTLSIVPAAAFAATQDVQAAINAGTEEIIVLEADASNITVNRDTIIDLNGHNIDGVTVLAGTLYCMDSQTADYTVADGVYGHVTNVKGSVKAAEGYLQVGDSFHAVNLDIYAMTLRAADVGVYYKSNFAADEVVAEVVESFGVALSVVTAPNADNLGTYCGYSEFTGFEAGKGANSVGTSTLLKGIMKPANGDNKNAKNAAMPVYGRAYIKTAEGYVFGETVKRSLQEQVEAIDGIWAGLKDSQKAPVLSMLEDYTAVMEGWNIPDILGGEAGEGNGEITVPVEVTAENGVVTETVTVEQGTVSITVPAGTKLAEGVSALTLTVTPKETSDAGLTLDKSEVLMPMDVHVEGLAADNAQPVTIYLGKVMAENLNMGNYTVYHVENGKANEMTLIPVDAEFTAHNQYKYSLDGELTLYMASFSEVAVVSDEVNAWNGTRNYDWYTGAIEKNPNEDTFYIRNADQLAGFGAIVGGMDGQTQDSFAGKTVVLLADISIGDLVSDNGKVFYPIGYYNNEGTYEKSGTAITSSFRSFEGTFDGNGNTVSNFYQNTWEMKGDHNWYDATLQYYRDGMGLFGKVYGGTVKNLTVDNFSSDGEITTTGVIAAYADCGATFENISIFNCNPRVYNIGNGGIVGCVGWYTKDETETPVSFTNITVDQTNKISALWGTYDVSCGGIVGQYYAVSGQDSAGNPKNAGMTFENCHVAAVMDVNNDVCANYQYYWYRYSGMLVGTVRANKKDADGYTVADTTGIVAKDCTYTYGSWNEYWYCELVKNSSASYTHDYQFSRLTTIANLSEIQDASGNWNKEGNFVIPNADNTDAECYHIFKKADGTLYQHFHDVADESNPDIYEDFDLNGDGKLNDLKEDRQRYYLPFGQVLNGLGYGVKPTYEFDGFKLVEDGSVKSREKFEIKDDAALTYLPGQKIYLKDILALSVEPEKLSQSSLYATVSPVTETGIAGITEYYKDNDYWENNYIVFSEDSVDAAKLVITDYFYCTPTVVYLNPVTAAPKFEAKSVAARDAYTTITLGDLFGVKADATISANVTATVTNPNGTVTTETVAAAEWASKTIDLTKDGTWKVVIVENDASCEATTVTFTVNKADKFTKKFDKNFLYRVGNENAFDIGYIFGEKETAIALDSSNVEVEITEVDGDVTWTVTPNTTTWTSGTLDFDGTGVVEVTISAEGVNNISLFLEVIDAKNLTGAEGATGTEKKWAAVVLIKDINTADYRSYTYAKVHGNGFTYSLNGAPTTYKSAQGHGVLILKNAELDNVVIVGDVYNSYGAYSNQDYYNVAIDCVSGNTVIRNCYIANCAAPGRVRGGNVTIENTTLYGGTVANLILDSGTTTLNNVTTANFDDGRQLVGMGIVFHPDATSSAKLIVNGTLKQYNFMSEANVPSDTYAKQIHSTMFGTACEAYQFDTSSNRYVNAGIVSMTDEVTFANVVDNANTGYTKTDVTLGTKNGFVYSQLKTVGSVDNSYDFDNDPHVASVYGAVEPVYEFDYTVKNYKAKEEGNNDYCYEENDTVHISMDEGDAFNWDTSILTAEKIGNTLAYTVSMNGVDYTGKSIAFNTADDYTVTYSYTDPYNYTLDANGNITTYSVSYQKTVKISVAVIEAATKHAEFTFGSSNTASTTVVAGTDTYVMPDVTGTSSTIGSTTVSGQTIYYPIVEIIMSDNKTSHTSGWYAYFPVFSGAVTITDYKDGGTSDETDTFNSATTDMPSNLSVIGDPASLFKYQSKSNAGTEPVVKNNILVYSSAKIEAKRDEYNVVITYCYTDNAKTPYYYCIGYHAPAQSYTNICVTPDTLVTLADGTQKEIQYVTYEDQLLVWDFYTGEHTVVPSSHLVNHGYADNAIIHLNFADGTVIKVVNKHAFFDMDTNEFALISGENVADYAGHRFVKQDGTTTVLESYSIEEKYIESYSILSVKHYNCYLEGMLSLTPPEASGNYFMPFEVGENMTFDAEKMAEDIEKYGLFTYEEFADRVSEKVFYALNAPQVKVAIGKGIITMEEFEAIVNALADKDFAD